MALAEVAVMRSVRLLLTPALESERCESPSFFNATAVSEGGADGAGV